MPLILLFALAAILSVYCKIGMIFMRGAMDTVHRHAPHDFDYRRMVADDKAGSWAMLLPKIVVVTTWPLIAIYLVAISLRPALAIR